MQQGKFTRAVQLLRPACGANAPPELNAALMNACIGAGEPERALKAGVAALARLPQHPALARTVAGLHNQVGVRVARRGDELGAIDHFQAALELAPQLTDARFNLARRLQARANYAAALALYDELAAADDDIAVQQHRIDCLIQLGRHPLAVDALRARLKQPDIDANRAVGLGDLAQDLDEQELIAAWDERAMAAGADRQALERHRAQRQLLGAEPERGASQLQALATGAPPDAEAAMIFCRWAVNTLDHAAARRVAEAAALPTAELMRAHFGAPEILPDAQCIDGLRQTMLDGAQRLWASEASAGASLDDLYWSNFYLPYQGRNDLQLQRLWGDLMQRAATTRDPTLATPPTPHKGRARVGLLGRWGDNVVGHYFGSWIGAVRQAGLLPIVFNTAAADAHTQQLCRGVETHALAPTAAEAAQQIRRAGLRVLIIPELGHDPRVNALAACRLAPVQLLGWGMPVTSGLPTVDGFISCAAMEPENATDHYRERLLLLPGIGTSFPEPPPPSRRSRSELGLPAAGPLVLFPHSPFKVHPDADLWLAEILAAHPDATAVLFRTGATGQWTRYEQRLSATLAQRGIEFRTRTRVLRPLSRPDYLAVNRHCAVLLDTPHFSGGNTTLDALGSGLPVVTWEGPWMRGRQSAAMLRRVGLEDLVCADPAAVPQRVGAVLSAPLDAGEIKAAARTLYGDRTPLRAFQEMLADVARAD